MDLSPFNYTKWTDRMAFDMALLLEGSGESVQEIATRHHLSMDDMAEFSKEPLFLKKVENYREEVREKGLTFKMKARAQAEELLVTSWTLIHSPDVSAAVKADLIKQTVKWGGLEPKTDVDAGGGGGVRITINLGPTQQEDTSTVIEHEASIDGLVEPA
jgi:hypothetical protein